ncbi:MAG: hypothetical protein AAF969_11835 [Bacteroidota bacterium]
MNNLLVLAKGTLDSVDLKTDPKRQQQAQSRRLSRSLPKGKANQWNWKRRGFIDLSCRDQGHE